MSIVDDVILIGERILIPPSLRNTVCKILHSTHQGTNAMRERAKATVFWPGITEAINATREKCTSCWRMTPSQPHLLPADPFIPTYPFEAIATDFCKQGGHNYLITVDRFSNWPEVLKVNPGGKSAGSSGLISALKSYFSTLGVPEELSSDGGPEFKSKDIASFLKRWGVRHRLSSSYNPRSNGRAEAAVKSMKQLLSNNVSLDGELNTGAFTQAILQYRNTPDQENAISPAEIVFGRPLRDCLPVKPRTQIFTNTNVRPMWTELWKKREETLRTRFARQKETLSTNTRQLPPLNIGENCRIQNQHGQFPKKWDRTGKVVEVKDNDQYVVKVDGSGRLTLRNRRYLRKIQLLTERHYPQQSSGKQFQCTEEVTPFPASKIPLTPTIQEAHLINVKDEAVTTGDSQQQPRHVQQPQNVRQPCDSQQPRHVQQQPQDTQQRPRDVQQPQNVQQPQKVQQPRNVQSALTVQHAPAATGNATQSVNAVKQPARIRKTPTWHDDYVMK